MMHRYTRWLALAAFAAACDTPLDTDPTDSIDAGEAITDAEGVRLAVVGTYSALQGDLDGQALYSRELVVYPDLYADNLIFTGTFGTDLQVANRNILPSNGAILDQWTESYEGINRANNVLAAIGTVEDLAAEEADQYRGEALFLRALNYLNLTRYFGGVPVVTEPSVEITEESRVARNTAAEVYAQIVMDLEEAATLLAASGEPGRATRGAANALLARAYLEMGEWAAAGDKATAVIGSGEYQLVVDYGDLFAVQNTAEAIFELQYSVNDNNNLAFWYFPEDLGGRQGFTPSQDLYDAFEPGDERRDVTIDDLDGNLFGVKYFRVANGDDNVIVLRLAEMYLTRAEANLRLGADPTTVRADVDVIRSRAGLSALPAAVDTEAELADAILQERRTEFALEGYRFFDLRRMGRAMEFLGIAEARLLFPIPQEEIDVNIELEQNPGY